MIVGVGIIDFHVLEEPLDVLIEEALNFSIIEFRINKEGTNVRLHDIRESLRTSVSDKRPIREVGFGYLWSCLGQSPIVSGAISVVLYLFEILHVFTILTLDDCAMRSNVFVKTKFHTHRSKELVRHHGHLKAVSQVCTMGGVGCIEPYALSAIVGLCQDIDEIGS